jgi:hypothetical protein
MTGACEPDCSRPRRRSTESRDLDTQRSAIAIEAVLPFAVNAKTAPFPGAGLARAAAPRSALPSPAVLLSAPRALGAIASRIEATVSALSSCSCGPALARRSRITWPAAVAIANRGRTCVRRRRSIGQSGSPEGSGGKFRRLPSCPGSAVPDHERRDDHAGRGGKDESRR